jgi:hypothetical protein
MTLAKSTHPQYPNFIQFVAVKHLVMNDVHMNDVHLKDTIDLSCSQLFFDLKRQMSQKNEYPAMNRHQTAQVRGIFIIFRS